MTLGVGGCAAWDLLLHHRAAVEQARVGRIEASLVIGVVQGQAGGSRSPGALPGRARAACVLAREPGVRGISIA